MKNVTVLIACFLLGFTKSSFSQNTIDLHQLVAKKKLEVYNRELSLINEDHHAGIHLSKDDGEGIAWLKGVEFANGILEFDVRGENVKGHSFVGIAFHGRDNDTFNAIYLRPFQFQEEDEILRSHSIQYIALPAFTWRILREKFPNKYEHSIDPSPSPNAWVKVRVVVENSSISTYINGNQEPSLVVEKVDKITSGAVGFYVADTSGGDFANLTITNTN